MKNNQWEICVANQQTTWDWFAQQFSADDVRQSVGQRLGHRDFTLRVVCTL